MHILKTTLHPLDAALPTAYLGGEDGDIPIIAWRTDLTALEVHLGNVPDAVAWLGAFARVCLALAADVDGMPDQREPGRRAAEAEVGRVVL